MNSFWISAAHEVANVWHAAQANPTVAIAALALAAAAGHQLTRLVPPKRTLKAYDNPELKVLREKRQALMQHLGIEPSKPVRTKKRFWQRLPFFVDSPK